MEWKDLNILDKSKWILFFVSQGIIDKSLMLELYDLGINTNPKTTYTSWLGAMHNKYPWLELNSEKAGYDYERYFNENYDDAISRLNELLPRHFTDKYKLPNHPTFSEESIYSQGPRYGGRWTDDNEFIPSVINQLQYPDIYLEYRPYSEDEIYKSGGSIHIKPENRGKFTELKKRTGHSASWFKAHGTPALKKMAIFALNARHWKHLDGGHLFATGNPLFDWDPDNPYHYHTANGEKVVITPEDWEKHKGLSYFKQIEDAVLAELTAHPGPEYIINPQFSEDLRMVYKGNMGPKYQNYSSFYGNLPQGYSFTHEGLVLDNQGNLYVLKGFRQTPRFTYDENKPLVFPVLEGRNQGNITFYPVNMEKTIKPSLPISSIMNVDKEHESAIKKAQNQYEYPVTLWDILPTGEGVISTYDGVYSTSPYYGDDYSKNYHTYKDKGAKQFFENYISNIIGREIKLNGTSYMWDDNGGFRNVYADDVFNLSPREFNLVKKKLKEAKNRDYEFEKKKTEENLNKFKQEGILMGDDEDVYRNSIKYYEDWINQDNPWLWGADEDRSPKPRKISRKEAEKKAVIEVGPLQVDKIETFGDGGHLFQGLNNSKLAEINNAMHYSGGSHNPLEIIYNSNIMPSQNYYNGTHYPGQYISNLEELLPNGRDHINLYTYGDQKGFEKFNNPTPITVNGQTYNYDLYNGNILPIDTLFLQKDITQPVIDSMIKNNDILGLNTDYFLVPANKDEYPTIYNNIYNYPNVDLNTVLDDTRNVSMSPKRDKNGNYYADVFDIIDFNNTLGTAGNYLDKQAQKAGAYGPYILRLQIPIKFTSGKSNGKMLGLLSSLNKNGKTWESLLLKYSTYYKQLRNNNQYPATPKANGGQIIWDNMGLLNPKLKGKITGIVGTTQGTPITMENVNIDLIGKDNLGNIQYMTLGNNYFFPGEYVVEYPVNTHSRQYGGVIKNTQNFIAPYLQDLVSRHYDNFTYLPQYMQDYVLKDVAYVNPNQYERPNQLLVNLVTPLQSKLKRSLSDYVDKNKLDYMQTVWDYLDKYNMSPYNRAALMGNIMLESGFNPKAKNPKSSAYGLFLMLDTPRNKAYKWMNQNKITDKDLGQIDWYVHLMNDNVDEYMDEYNNFMSRWDKVRQQYELNPSSTNKKYMDLYQIYYDNTYKNRVDNNEMWSVLDLNNTWNNINSSLADRTIMFERVFEKAGPGAEHLKRINSANDILDYFYPNHIVVDAMKKDPLNYINGEFQYDEFGEPIKKQYGGLIKPFSYNRIPLVRY